MNPIGEPQLKKVLSSGTFQETYVIFGDDTYLKQFYVKRMIKKIVGENDALNFTRFNGTVDSQQLYDAVTQLPFLAERRCVLVCDYDVEKQKADDLETICSVLTESHPMCVLIFWFDTIAIDTKELLKKHTLKKLEKFMTLCEKNQGAVVQLDHRKDSELLKLLQNGAAKRGCRLETTVARYLLEICGKDIQTLQSEVEKLCAFAPDQSITREMVDQVSIRSIDADIFQLTQKINRRDGDGAMQLLGDLFFQKEDPISIFAILSQNYVDLYHLKAAECSGVPKAQMAEQLRYGKRAFVLNRLEPIARRYTAGQLSECLSILLEADAKLKSIRATGKAEYSRTILEQTIVQLMMCPAGGRNG